MLSPKGDTYMRHTQVATGLGVLLGMLGLVWPVSAGMKNIGTPAGCHSTFRGSKGAIAACTSCVRGGGRYKLTLKKAWVCTR